MATTDKYLPDGSLNPDYAPSYQPPTESVPGQSGRYGGINPGGTMYSDPAASNYIGTALPKATTPATAGLDSALRPDETVEGRLPGILATDNPLMKAAETYGLQLGNKRGLLDSSISVGAAQGEMIKAALPIAQQDAQAMQNQRQGLLSGDIQSNLSKQDTKQVGELEQLRGRISSALSAQNAEQAANAAALANGLGTAAAKEDYASLATGVQQQYQVKYLEIQQTPDTVMNAAAKAKVLSALNSSTRAQLDMLNSIYSVPMTWDGGSSTPVGTAPPTGSTASLTQTVPAPSSPDNGGILAPWEAPASAAPWESPTTTTTTVSGVDFPLPAVKASDGTATSLQQFQMDLANSPATYESDSFWSLSRALPVAGYEWTPDPTENRRRQKAAQDQQAMDVFSSIAYLVAKPDDTAMIKAITVAPTRTGNGSTWNPYKETYPETPEGRISRALHAIPYVDPNQLPPSQRESLPWWQKWVNQYIYNK